MPTLTIDPLHPDPAHIARAAEIIRRGGLVAFPTETVYGLGANALDAAAVQRIFEAKGRPSYNPLIVHVRDVEQARSLVSRWPATADALAEAFWPGPLTLVLRRRAEVPDVVTAGRETVAVRAPAHPVALALLAAADLPIAAPSANRFTELSPTLARHVERALGRRVELILDGGPTTVGIESTVLDLSGGEPVLLRPGGISADQIAAVIGVPPRPIAPSAYAGSTPRPAPGMVERHYAPRAALHLFAPHERSTAVALARREAAAGHMVGALLFAPLEAPLARAVMMPDDAAEYARQLYGTLHALDDAGCTLVLVERVPEGPAWDGVRDRLERAARSK